MSLLSSLFKSSKKTNLTEDVTPLMPSQINPQAYGDLSRLSHNYTNGIGTGFGDDFVGRATNGPIASREARFNEVELPQLSSQLSSRGVARSVGPNLASDVLTRAGQSKERDINDLISQFYTLNETQKKTDEGNGVSIGQNLLSGDVQAQQEQAAASRARRDATAGDARTRYAADEARAGKIVGTVMNAIVPGSGMAFTGSPMGGQQTPNSTQYQNQQPKMGTRTLDDNDYQNLAAMLKKMGAI